MGRFDQERHPARRDSQEGLIGMVRRIGRVRPIRKIRPILSAHLGASFGRFGAVDIGLIPSSLESTLIGDAHRDVIERVVGF
jgi:hypothetical protein